MMEEYEKNQIHAIGEWKNREPSVVSQKMGAMAAPLGWIVQRVIPEVAMRGVLNGANSAGEFLADEGDIIRDGGIRDIEELRHKDLQLSDKLADSVHNWAIAAAVAEGAATGAGGVLGIGVDIPAILTLSLRTIHKIGLCYGYKANNKSERDFVLGVLSAAGSNSMKEKTEALLALRVEQNMIRKYTWKALAEKGAVVMTVKQVCKQLGINLTKRKAMQAIPAIGGGIGAAVNGEFMRDIGYAARRSYQERWLRDNDKWIE
jgi:hypothetical protein